MIIRINKFPTTFNPDSEFQYSATLSTEAGEICVVPAHSSFTYVDEMVRRLQKLLLAKTSENIRIDYPLDLSNLTVEDSPQDISMEDVLSGSSRFDYDGFAKTKTPLGKWTSSGNGAITDVWTYNPTPKPFNPAGTLSTIQTQSRNVSERATLSDYTGFVEKMNTPVAQLEDDLKKRNEEERERTAAAVPSLTELITKRVMEREESNINRKYVSPQVWVENNIMPLIRDQFVHD